MNSLEPNTIISVTEINLFVVKKWHVEKFTDLVTFLCFLQALIIRVRSLGITLFLNFCQSLQPFANISSRLLFVPFSFSCKQ